MDLRLKFDLHCHSGEVLCAVSIIILADQGENSVRAKPLSKRKKLADRRIAVIRIFVRSERKLYNINLGF